MDSDSALQQQIEYYRARAGEYDQWFYRQGRYDHGPARNQLWFEETREVADALDAFRPAGSVLELACGTGNWTGHLLRHATDLTAVDATPEVLALHRQKHPEAKIEYIEADLFSWEPPRQFDVVFFGFFLSHVPPEKFAPFWRLVGKALRPGGRFFLVDSLREESSGAADHQLPGPTEVTMRRRLNDGREFSVYKVFYEPEALETRLRGLGWNATASRTAHYFLHAEGSRA
jgi:demethylmenaquinone methyltransferase/2-methoxy-6-polyprenyl-1,4-benzoquinol methylase